MLEYHGNKALNKNHIKIQRKKENRSQYFEILKISIKLPKIILSAVETITIITNKPREKLFNEFIVNELDSFSYDLDPLFRLFIEKSTLLERLRIGINQYYARKIHEKKLKSKKPKDKKRKFINYDYEIIDILIELPKKLANFISVICEISNIQKESFFSMLVISQLEYIYSEPEVLFNYISEEDGIYKDLREGIEDYYKNDSVLK